MRGPDIGIRPRKLLTPTEQLARMLEALTDSNQELSRELQALRALVYAQRKELTALNRRVAALEPRQRDNAAAAAV